MILHGHLGTLASGLLSIAALAACVVVARGGAEAGQRLAETPRQPPGLDEEEAYFAGLIGGDDGAIEGATPRLRAVISRRDPHGAHVFHHECRGSGAMSEPRVAVEDGGGALVALTFEGAVDCGTGPILAAGGPSDFDALVMRLDSRGAVRWIRTLSDAGPQALAAVAVDPWGGVIVAGSFEGTIDLGGPSITAGSARDVLLAALDPDGHLVWQRHFASAGSAYGVDVDVARSGRIVLLARGSAEIDFGTGPLSASRSAAFVAAFDPDGRSLWSHAITGAGDIYPARIRALPGNRTLVTGAFVGDADFGAGPVSSAGRSDAFAAELDAHGQLVGSARLGEALREASERARPEMAPSLALRDILDRLTGNADCPDGPPSCGQE